MTDLKDPLDEIFEDFSGDKDVSLELFSSNSDGVTLKTDLNDKEVFLANNILIDGELIKKDLGFDLYGSFLENFKRHKVSRDRKSRSEFVDVNKKDKFDDHLSKFANLRDLADHK